MKLSRNCGIPFKITSIVQVVAEILACGVSTGLCAYAYANEEEKIIYFYDVSKSKSYLVTNRKMAACVTYWILTLLLLNVIVRVGAVSILALGIKKNSPSMCRFWIGTKLLSAILSSFIFIASMTVSLETKIAASFDMGAQILTSYFICILMPELVIMARTLIVKVKETS